MPRTAKRTQPPNAEAAQAYGERGDQIAAQKVIPLPDRRSLPAAPPASPAPGASPSAPGPDAHAAALEAMRQMAFDPVPLDAPTQRPDEPVTAGLPIGPGPGPEALSANVDPDLSTLAPLLPMLELAASQANASSSTRNWVRRLRGAMALVPQPGAQPPTPPGPPA